MMHKELHRLASFSKWSKLSKISPMQLARHGFYYSTASDKLVCHGCGCSISDLNDNENPLEIHSRLSPNCDLHIPMDINTVHLASPFTTSSLEEPLENLYTSAWNRANTKRLFECDTAVHTINRDRPDFDMLRSERVRLGTFHDWPTTANAGPGCLAREGFFYRGVADRVQCAFCRGYLSSWQPCDEPHLEHLKHFPECPFVKGLDVDNVPLDANSRTCGITSSTGATTIPKQREDIQANGSQTLLSEYADEHTNVLIFDQLRYNREVDVAARMSSPAVRAVLNMGFSEDAVRSVLSNKLAQTGTDFPNAESLLDAIFNSGDEPQTHFNHNSAATTTENDISMADNMSPSTDINEFSNPTASMMAGGTGDSSHSTEFALRRQLSEEDSSTTSLPTVGSTFGQPLFDLLSLGANLTETQIIFKPSETSETSEAKTTITTTILPETNVKRKGKKKKNRKISRLPASSNKDSMQGKIAEITRGSNIEETTDEEGEVIRYLAENQQLRDARTCKVCMDAEVDTVFLPCGHLVCCNRCSPQLRDCPVCRNFIRGTVKTFLN